MPNWIIHYLFKTMNKFIQWKNEQKVVRQEKCPIWSCGTCTFWHNAGYTDLRKTRSIQWTWRERAALLVSLLHVEQKNLPSHRLLPKVQRGKSFRWFSSWNLTLLCKFRELRTRVKIMIITGPDSPQNRGNRSSQPCKSVSWLTHHPSTPGLAGLKGPLMVSAPMDFLASSHPLN